MKTLIEDLITAMLRLVASMYGGTRANHIMGKGAVAPDLTGLGLPAPHVAAPTPPTREEK